MSERAGAAQAGPAPGQGDTQRLLEGECGRRGDAPTPRACRVRRSRLLHPPMPPAEGQEVASSSSCEAVEQQSAGGPQGRSLAGFLGWLRGRRPADAQPVPSEDDEEGSELGEVSRRPPQVAVVVEPPAAAAAAAAAATSQQQQQQQQQQAVHVQQQQQSTNAGAEGEASTSSVDAASSSASGGGGDEIQPRPAPSSPRAVLEQLGSIPRPTCLVCLDDISQVRHGCRLGPAARAHSRRPPPAFRWPRNPHPYFPCTSPCRISWSAAPRCAWSGRRGACRSPAKLRPPARSPAPHRPPPCGSTPAGHPRGERGPLLQGGQGAALRRPVKRQHSHDVGRAARGRPRRPRPPGRRRHSAPRRAALSSDPSLAPSLPPSPSLLLLCSFRTAAPICFIRLQRLVAAPTSQSHVHAIVTTLLPENAGRLPSRVGQSSGRMVWRTQHGRHRRRTRPGAAHLSRAGRRGAAPGFALRAPSWQAHCRAKPCTLPGLRLFLAFCFWSAVAATGALSCAQGRAGRGKMRRRRRTCDGPLPCRRV